MKKLPNPTGIVRAAQTGASLRNDNVYVKSSIEDSESFLGMPTRRGYEQVVVSEGVVVNMVSNAYGHLPNEKFFAEVEAALIASDIAYKTRSINHENRVFAVDYILDAKGTTIRKAVGKKNDDIIPMLRFVNSYDGSAKTSGYFCIYRKVCSNGLHVSDKTVGFAVRHYAGIQEVVIPKLKNLVEQFMSNEFYELSKKFEVLAETPVKDLSAFVNKVAMDLKLFKGETKGGESTKAAASVLETVRREADLLKVQPNRWLVYNAFNDMIHSKWAGYFDLQRNTDQKLFNYMVEMN